jgi:mannitol-1-phosphate 5-dehydrogenase
MALTGTRAFVGFGFGAIQSGLFLYEAYQSGNFGRLVVAEVMPEVVEAVRKADGFFTVNIAQPDRVENATIGPISIENPALEADRLRLIQAVAEAEEIATAVPSVKFYTSDSPGSLHHVLAEGLRKKAAENLHPAVIYTAENNNHAAEILEEAVMAEIPEGEREAVKSRVRFLDTVIAKMSGVMTDPAEIAAQKLMTVTPEDNRAFLVEAFNRILISHIDFDDPFERGIGVFEEKANLLPFEEAKLYGHNATHALAAYLGALRGVQFIYKVRDIPGVVAFLREAFIEESGAALIRKYAGLDPLFTSEGFTEYVDDLLMRMFNPFLQDTVERVGRDPARKLGWEDRLIGTMRLALSQGIEPRRYGMGAAAALSVLHPSALDPATSLEPLLIPLWGDVPAAEAAAVMAWIEKGRQDLAAVMR